MKKCILNYRSLTAIITGVICGYAIGSGWYYAVGLILIVSGIFIFFKKHLREETIFALLLTASLPWANEFGYGPLEFGFTVYPAYIFAFIGMALMFKNMVKTRNYSLISTPVDKYLLFLLYVMIVSTAQSRFINPVLNIVQSSANSIFNRIPGIRSFAQVAAIIYMALIYYFVVNAIKTKKEFIILLKVLFFSGAAISVYGLISYYLQSDCSFLGDPYNLYYGKFAGYFNTMKRWFGGCPVYINGLGNKRISTLFSEPMILSMYLVSFLPIACSLVFVKQKWIGRFCLSGVILLVLLTLFFSFSRSGWLSFFASVIVIAVFYLTRLKWNKKKFVVSALAFFITALVLILLISAIFHKGLTNIKSTLQFQSEGMPDFSRMKKMISGQTLAVGEYREAEWGPLLRINDSVAGIRMWLDHPILGIGWGNYIFHYNKYDPHIIEWSWETTTPANSVVGNLIVNFLAETGLIGFIIFALFIFKFAAVLISAINSTNDAFWKAVLIGYLGSFTAVFISYFFIPNLYFTFVWVMLGMAMAAVRISRKQDVN